MAAAAIAPLCFVGSQAAQAQVTISSNTSTPVATATANNGSPADVTLASGQTFTINAGTAAALTLNSNNVLTNSGTITSKNVDGTVGMLVSGTVTNGSLVNAGEINLTEDYQPSDSVNNDGITEAPYAQGSGRIGIRVVGPFTGTLDHAGSIDIQGNNSAGISVENKLTGDLIATGAINLNGDNNFGIHTTGEITGKLQVSGAINMKGAGSVGIQTDAPVDGALSIYGVVQTTGYAVSVRETGTNILQRIESTPADVEQGGSAVVINKSVLGGVLLGAPPSTTVSTDTTTDADGDGIVDSAEGTAALTTYGAAPALRIGGSTPITLGNFGTSDDNSFGLVIRGTVTGQGLLDGVTSNAIDIGAGGGGVNLTGGLHNIGSVTSASFQADSTAIHLESGVTGTQFWNSGIVSAAVTSSGANLATALQIDRGASITSFVNDGSISAGVTGDSANATAVVDRNGSINSVVNHGVIAAQISPALAGETTTGTGIALDLRANTSGITLTQAQTLDLVSPVITGDVLLGSGVNTVNLLGGSITGALSLGGAAGSSLTIDNGAVFKGALTYSGPGMAINVANGTLNDLSPTTVNATSLTVGSASTVSVALDPANNRSTLFNVAGTASFASGSKIGATLLSTPSLGTQTFTIVRAGALAVGSTDSSLLATLPYLFDASVKADGASKTIAITVRTKTPAELGFNKAETSAFNAIYAALPQDTGIQTAVIGATSRDALVSAYDQLLPNSSGDVFQTALGMSKAVSRATGDRFDLSTMSEDEDEDDYIVSGFWASEFYTGVEQNKVDNNAYHSAGLGVIGGYDFGGTGVTISAASSNITRPKQVGDSLNSVSVVELGAYAAPRFGPLMVDARLGAGYLKVSNRRQLVASIVSGDQSTTSTVTRTADGDWSGYDLTAHLGAALQWDFGKHLFLQPRVYADVLHMHENAYAERHGGAGYDFNVSERNGTQTNGTASFVTGLKFGNNFVFSPQLELGYDRVMTGGPGDTTARFAYGGPAFTVAANKMDGAALGRLTLRGDGNYVHFSLQAGGEYAKSYHTLDMKAVFRLTF